MKKKQAIKEAQKLILNANRDRTVNVIWGFDGVPKEYKDSNAACYFYDCLPDVDLHLNPKHFKNSSDYECRLTLIHELIHIIMRPTQEPIEHLNDELRHRDLERDTEKVARFIMLLLYGEEV